MATGLQIFNSAGQTVIDTERGESLLYAGNANTSSANSAYPTANWTGSNLILARPPSTSYNNKTISRYSWGGKWALAQTGAANSVVWRELRAQHEDALTPAGYGLVVYRSGGTASTDILLSATDLDSTAELVATGKFNGTTGTGNNDGYYQDFTMDSSLDKGRYYVLATNTQSQYAPGVRGSTPYQLHIDYRFDYTNGKIRMQNYLVLNQDTSAAASSQQLRGYDWAIFYVKNGGSTDDNFS